MPTSVSTERVKPESDSGMLLKSEDILDSSRISACNSGGSRCTNLRSACALALARRLDPDHYPGIGKTWLPFSMVLGLDWESIREELLGLRYHLDGDQSALESKEDFMDRLGRSPDFADALTQTFRQEAIEG